MHRNRLMMEQGQRRVYSLCRIAAGAGGVKSKLDRNIFLRCCDVLTEAGKDARVTILL